MLSSLRLFYQKDLVVPKASVRPKPDSFWMCIINYWSAVLFLHAQDLEGSVIFLQMFDLASMFILKLLIQDECEKSGFSTSCITSLWARAGNVSSVWVRATVRVVVRPWEVQAVVGSCDCGVCPRTARLTLKILGISFNIFGLSFIIKLWPRQGCMCPENKWGSRVVEGFEHIHSNATQDDP